MRQSLLTIVVTACCLSTGSSIDAQTPQPGIDPDLYVTRFEKQNRLVYEPKVEMVEKLQPKSSWIPFRTSREFERKLVPVVTWVPRWKNEVSPVTDRIVSRVTERSTRPNISETESGNTYRPWSATRYEKTHRVAQRDEMQLDGVIATGRIPTRTIPARPVDIESAVYGGIQKLSEDVPRVGMRLRETR